MPKYFVLVKNKGAKRWTGAIPARSGVTKARLQKAVRSQLRKGLTFRIVTETELKNYMQRLVRAKLGTKIKRKVKRKTTKKRKVKRKAKKRKKRK